MVFRRCYKCMADLSGTTSPICPVCGFDNAHPQQPEQALACGSILGGRYIIGKMLGQGGFGITYIGFDSKLEEAVCIKEFFPSGIAVRTREMKGTVYWSGNTDSASRKLKRESFVNEARKAAKVRKLSSVVNVWDVLYENETAYIIMEYIRGETLKEYLMKRGRPMDIKECLLLLGPVIRDLDSVHRKGIIHRDISPDNLMIQEDGSVMLLDLGAAKDLSFGTDQSTTIVIKRGFSPPEQYYGHSEIGPWTDVYAMTATLYWCMTMQYVPDANRRLLNDTLSIPPQIPLKTAAALRHGLTLKPEERTRDCIALLRELEEAVRTEDAAAEPVSPAALSGGTENADSVEKPDNSREAAQKEGIKDVIEETADSTDRKSGLDEGEQSRLAGKIAQVSETPSVSKGKTDSGPRSSAAKTRTVPRKKTGILLPAVIVVGLVICAVLFVKFGLKPEETIVRTSDGPAALTDSWEQIIAAGKDGTYAKRYRIGDTKELDLGEEGTVNMQLAAMDADELADGSGKAHMTWVAVELIKSDHQMNPTSTNEGGWPESDMRSWLRNSVLPVIPENVRSNIKEVTKYSYSYSDGGTISSKDTIWIPSLREVFGGSEGKHSLEDRGPEYSAVFPDDESRMRRKTEASDATWWWLRSASIIISSYFDLVSSDGDYAYSNFAIREGGVVVGFCL